MTKRKHVVQPAALLAFPHCCAEVR